MKIPYFCSGFIATLAIGIMIGSSAAPPRSLPEIQVRTDTYNVPLKYQRNRSVKLVEMTQTEIDKKCGVYTGLHTIACGDINGHTIHVPNSCNYPEAANHASYAYLICHEIAHTEGWNHIN